MKPINFTKRRMNTVPSGLIIPYNSASAVPTDWTAYSSADGKFIVGAGSTYAVGNSSKSSTSLTKATNNSGAHTDGIANEPADGSTSWIGGSSAGDHTHTLTMTYAPAYRKMILIKANSDLAQLPINGTVFGKSDLSASATNILSGDSKLFGADSAASNGSASVTVTNVTSAGSHTHATQSGTANEVGGTYCFSVPATGAHSDHTCTAVLNTDSVKKAILTAWSNASAAFNAVSGMIGMYENTTPPAGWYLCDGNNGTMDLRDYYIFIGTTGTHGTSSGNNTVSVNITIGSSSNTHNHQTGNHLEEGDAAVLHGSYSNTHSHDGTITGSSHAFIPVYYSLAFIQKA